MYNGCTYQKFLKVDSIHLQIPQKPIAVKEWMRRVLQRYVNISECTRFSSSKIYVAQPLALLLSRKLKTGEKPSQNQGKKNTHLE